MAKALIVSKDKEASYLLSVAITFQRIETQIAAGVKEAIKKIVNLKPDLVIFDVHGFELKELEALDGLKKSLKHLPLIILSDLSDKDARKKAALVGVSSYLKKGDDMLGRIIKATRRVLN